MKDNLFPSAMVASMFSLKNTTFISLLCAKSLSEKSVNCRRNF